MPSAEGPVLFFGKLWTTDRQLMSLWLLVDPNRPGAPVAVNYAISTTVAGYPAHLATYPASPDGNLLGIRPLYFLTGPGKVVGGAPFALDRANGTVGPVTSPSWRVKASSVPPAAGPQRQARSPPAPCPPPDLA